MSPTTLDQITAITDAGAKHWQPFDRKSSSQWRSEYERQAAGGHGALMVRVLEGLGIQRIRQSGNHATFRHPDGRWTIVSVHGGETIPNGTLHKIIRDAGLTVDELIDML